MKNTKVEKRIRLKKKIRSKVVGTVERPRLSVFRSNNYIYAQLIDDEAGKTITQASDIKDAVGKKAERAMRVGKAIAENAIKANIKEVVFDRNGFKYIGRVKLLADEARKAGLQF